MAYDYIIVGAGTAGCVLAGRLSEDGKSRVLLLEAGTARRDLRFKVPAGYFKTIFDTTLGWGYATEPQKELNDRKIEWPRGKILGGTGAINGMIYVPGHVSDFEAWEVAAGQSWGPNAVLNYFKKSQRRVSKRSGDRSNRVGQQGQVWVSDFPYAHPLCDAFINSAAGLGHARNPDFSANGLYGAGYYQITTRKGLRCDTYTAFLEKAKTRSNLTILSDVMVLRVVFDGTKATGVKYLRHGIEEIALAQGEVALCAGTINTPQLLQLSGIGDPNHLYGLGINPVSSLPAVGQNLQDHLQVQTTFETQKGISLNEDINSLWKKARMALRYVLTRTGPIAGGPAPAGAFLPFDLQQTIPQVQLHFLPLSLKRAGVIDDFPGFTLTVCACRPKSRGDVCINSADIDAHPVIRANYLEHPDDLSTLLEGIKICRRIATSEPLTSYRRSEVRPGEKAKSDSELIEFIRATATSLYHPVGTCRMGLDNDSVVDPELRVRGVDGLRVADASVMPNITSGNTQAPTMMIAEHAADLVRLQ